VSPSRRAWPGFAFAAAALAVLLLEGFGQLGFRLKHGDWPRAFARANFDQPIRLYMGDHPYLPYLATKGVEGRVEFDALGNRGRGLETPKRRVRVLCYGGSTTFDAAHDWEQTWPGRLQALLGPKYEVVIAAQNGATTADTLVNYALVQSSSEADFVLAYEGINDLESSYAPGFRTDYAHRRRKIGESPYPFFERLPRALHYSACYTALRWKLVGPRGDLHAQFSRPTAYDFKKGPFGLRTFERNLESLHALTRARGARLVLGTAQYYRPWADAHFGADFGAGWERGIKAENAIQRALSRRLADVALADVANSFTPTEAEMTDFCHLTPRGNEFVARAFWKALKTAQARR
jgi:hypothetical protein